MSALLLRPAPGPLDAVVRLPGSKSLTNRALMVAALADGKSTLRGALLADDTGHMLDALRTLEIPVEVDEDRGTITVHGCGGHIPASGAELYCGNSGTTMRFGTALVSIGLGDYRLEGTRRMGERPIGPLVEALRGLGGRFEYLGAEGYPPLVVHAAGLDGGEVHLSSPPSSQMISALLMAAPYARNDVFIEVGGERVSEPYVTMTLKVMEAFGVTVLANVSQQAARYVVAAPQRYRRREYDIEPDATNASYFLAAPAVAGGRVTVEGLGLTSLQGDVGFVDLLERMGCRVERSAARLTVYGPAPPAVSVPGGPGRQTADALEGKGQARGRLRGIDADLNHMPDVAQTLAVLALFAEGATRIRNVQSLRIKETDRLAALARELTRLGATVETQADGLTIHPPAKIQPAAIETYDDHRMAMSFAIAGLAVGGIAIKDPGCVSKTFPDFFERWGRLIGSRPSSGA